MPLPHVKQMDKETDVLLVLLPGEAAEEHATVSLEGHPVGDRPSPIGERERVSINKEGPIVVTRRVFGAEDGKD